MSGDIKPWPPPETPRPTEKDWCATCGKPKPRPAFEGVPAVSLCACSVEKARVEITDAERAGGWFEDGVWVAPEALVVGIVKQRLDAALAVVQRACDIECKSPGKHTGCSSHEPYRVLRDALYPSGSEATA